MTHNLDTVQNLIVAAAELRYLGYDEPENKLPYTGLAEALEEIAENVEFKEKIKGAATRQGSQIKDKKRVPLPSGSGTARPRQRFHQTET